MDIKNLKNLIYAFGALNLTGLGFVFNKYYELRTAIERANTVPEIRRELSTNGRKLDIISHKVEKIRDIEKEVRGLDDRENKNWLETRGLVKFNEKYGYRPIID